MILVDANLLVYAHVDTFSQHQAAHEWLNGQINDVDLVGLPWPSLLAFVRLVSNPRIFDRPLPIKDAWRQVECWLAAESASVPLPTERHRDILAPLMRSIDGRANLVPDAHLAALAIEHGLTLCSCDQDFARFEGLRWLNPLD